MIKLTNYLTHSYGKPDSWKLSAYEAAGGYRGVRKALGMSRDQVTDEMKKAHIRGRGGAGFDCGTKWSFMPKEVKKPHYLVVNADEGEPGTFKDRSIMELNPPFPAQYGAFGNPSTVNNVETIAIAPSVFEVGGDEFSKLSALHGLNDGGARIFGVSGHVKKPGLYEAAVGLTLRDLIYDLGGGVLGDRPIIGVIPGGSSCPVHKPDEIINHPDPRFAPYNGKSILDLPLGVDTFRMTGSMLGTCCAIVLSDAADPVLALHNLMRFYRHESCGQCTPCREACGWIERILEKVVHGNGSIAELDQISEIASDITGNTICAFGDGAAQPALTFVRKFRKELEDYVHTGGKSQTGRLTV